MKHLQTFESFLNEAISFKEGDKIKHPTFKDITGTITAPGPQTWANLQDQGYDKDTEFEEIEEPAHRADAQNHTKRVWYGVELEGANKGMKVIMHQDNIKKQ